MWRVQKQKSMNQKGSLFLLVRISPVSVRISPVSGVHLTCQGALSGADVAALRNHVNAACRALAADGGRLAIRLCDGFGIPDHLLHAPIAFDWRTM
jgi:hypothetical protein